MKIISQAGPTGRGVTRMNKDIFEPEEGKYIDMIEEITTETTGLHDYTDRGMEWKAKKFNITIREEIRNN